MSFPKGPRNGFDPDFIRDLSERVYRAQLGPDDTRRMIEKDEDSGEKLRGRASSYDHLTRAYLAALGVAPTKPNDAPAVLIGPAIAPLEEITGAPV